MYRKLSWLISLILFIYLFIYLFIIKLCPGLLSSLGLTITYILGHCWLLSRVTCRARYCYILSVCPSVRPSVRPSRGGMVFKRMHTLGVFGAGVIFAPGDRWKTLTLTLTLTPTFYRLYSFAFSLDRLERSRYLYSSTSSHAMRKTFLVWFPISVL